MKKIIFLLTIITLISCQSNEGHQVASDLQQALTEFASAEPKLTFILVDRSMSHAHDQSENEEESIKNTVLNRLRKEGDKTVLIFCYSNTNNIDLLHEFTIKTPAPKIVDVNGLESKRKLSSSLNSITEEKSQIEKQISNLLEIESTSQWSKIVESLYTIERKIKRFQGEDIEIHIWSDLNQNSEAYKMKSNSLKQSLKIAQNHTELLKSEFQLNDNFLSRVDLIKAHLPRSSKIDRQDEYNFKEAYWQSLLETFGFQHEFKIVKH